MVNFRVHLNWGFLGLKEIGVKIWRVCLFVLTLTLELTLVWALTMAWAEVVLLDFYLFGLWELMWIKFISFFSFYNTRTNCVIG